MSGKVSAPAGTGRKGSSLLTTAIQGIGWSGHGYEHVRFRPGVYVGGERRRNVSRETFQARFLYPSADSRAHESPPLIPSARPLEVPDWPNPASMSAERVLRVRPRRTGSSRVFGTPVRTDALTASMSRRAWRWSSLSPSAPKLATWNRAATEYLERPATSPRTATIPDGSGWGRGRGSRSRTSRRAGCHATCVRRPRSPAPRREVWNSRARRRMAESCTAPSAVQHRDYRSGSTTRHEEVARAGHSAARQPLVHAR